MLPAAVRLIRHDSPQNFYWTASKISVHF